MRNGAGSMSTLSMMRVAMPAGLPGRGRWPQSSSAGPVHVSALTFVSKWLRQCFNLVPGPVREAKAPVAH